MYNCNETVKTKSISRTNTFNIGNTLNTSNTLNTDKEGVMREIASLNNTVRNDRKISLHLKDALKETKNVSEFIIKKIGGEEYLVNEFDAHSILYSEDRLEKPFLQFHLNPIRRRNKKGKIIKNKNSKRKLNGYSVRGGDIIRIELDTENVKNIRGQLYQKYDKYNIIFQRYNFKTFDKTTVYSVDGVKDAELKEVMEVGANYLNGIMGKSKATSKDIK